MRKPILFLFVAASGLHAQALSITSSSLPNGSMNVPYSATLTATGGTPPYTWTPTWTGRKSTPAGLSFDSSTGAISGIPTKAYSDYLRIHVTDSASATTSVEFLLTIIGNTGVNPVLDDVTHSTARLSWFTPTPSDAKLWWGTSSQSGCSGYTYSYVDPEVLFTHGLVFNGLAPATTYHYRISASNGSNCTAEDPAGPLTTLALPSPHPMSAILPQSTVDTTMPVWAATVSVSSDCSDLRDKFNTAATSGPDYTLLLIPHTAHCYGDFNDLAASTTYHIGIASDQHEQLTPFTGKTPADVAAWLAANQSKMPILEGNTFVHESASTISSPLTNANCSFGSYVWQTSLAGPWKMKYCGETSVGTAITTTGALAIGYTHTFSGPPGVAVGDHVYVAGDTGQPMVNGSATVTAVSGNTATVAMVAHYGDVVGPKGTPSGGSVMTKAVWEEVPFTDISSTHVLPDTCTTGDWAYDSTIPEDYNTRNIKGSYRCISTNNWVRWRIFYGGTTVSPGDYFSGHSVFAFSIGDRHVQNVRLIGLQIGHVAPPADPLAARLPCFQNQCDGTPERPGHHGAYPLIYIGGASSHIILDRIYAYRNWPEQEGRILMDFGDHTAVINSVIAETTNNGWSDPNDRAAGQSQDNAAGAMILTSAGGPKLYQDNFIQGLGITWHSDDSANFFGQVAHDVTVKRNSFYRPPSKFYGCHDCFGTGESSDGWYYPHRQILELKSGARWLIDGNTFNGNWRNVSQGAAFYTWQPSSGSAGFGIEVASDETVSSLESYPLPVSAGNYLTLSDGNQKGNLGMFQVQAGSKLRISPGRYKIDCATCQEGTHDITFTNNVIQNMPNGINVSGRTLTGNAIAPVGARWKISNNLGINIRSDVFVDPNPWNSSGNLGYFIGVNGGAEDVLIDHNTAYHVSGGDGVWYVPLGAAVMFLPGSTYFTAGPPLTFPVNEGVHFTNNLYVPTGNSIGWEPIDNGIGSAGTAALNFAIRPTNSSVTGNGFVKATGHTTYPAGNKWLTSESAVLFRGSTCTVASCSLGPSSPWHNAGTDGADIGADMTALLAAQGTVGCAFTLPADGFPAPAGGGPGAISLTALDSTCPWTAGANAAWLHLTSPASGTGSSIVSYAVDPNPGVPRTGALTLAGQVFTIRQAGTVSSAGSSSLSGRSQVQ